MFVSFLTFPSLLFSYPPGRNTSLSPLFSSFVMFGHFLHRCVGYSTGDYCFTDSTPGLNEAIG